MIIEAVHQSQLPGSGIAYAAVLCGVFVTAFYIFRMLFMTFYGKPRMDEHTLKHVRESPWVVTVPLVLLAIPSLVIGFMTIEPLLFGGYFGGSIKVSPTHDVVRFIGEHYRGVGPFIAHGLQSVPFMFAVAGIGLAWFMYIRYPFLPGQLREKFGAIYTLLLRKYFVDEFNDYVFAGGARAFGGLLWKIGDIKLIDGLAVNGTARVIGWVSLMIRRVQSGYVYHYAFAMILGLFLLITFFLHR
jgi:NADH-quinone oxidoreductase subunit L